MTNDQLQIKFDANEFAVRREASGRWVHDFPSGHTLLMIHNEDKHDLVFKVELLPSTAEEPPTFFKKLLEFNLTLLNGAFAVDEGNSLVFTDRIPTFDLDWGEANRTILTAKRVCECLDYYLGKARES